MECDFRPRSWLIQVWERGGSGKSLLLRAAIPLFFLLLAKVLKMRGREEEWEHPGPSGQLQLRFQTAFHGLYLVPSPAACCSSMGDVPKVVGISRNPSWTWQHHRDVWKGRSRCGIGVVLVTSDGVVLCSSPLAPDPCGMGHHWDHSQLCYSGKGPTPIPCCALQSELHKEKSIPDFQKKQLLVAFYSNLSHLHPPSAQAQGARPLAKLAVNSQGKQPWKSRKRAWLCWNILPQSPHPLFLAGRGFHRDETP